MNGKYLSLEMHSTRNPLVTSTQNYMPFEGPENLRAKSVITLNTSNFDVTIDGQQFTNLITEVDYSNGVDMFVPKSVKVHPITGEPNEYELCILEIPQFKSFKLGTFTGNVVGEKTNHKIFYVDFEVPTETDVTNMTAEFETFGEGVTVTSKGQPLESGNILQLEQDAVNVNLYSDTLDLYFAQPGYEEIFNISSKTIVTVTKQ